MSGTFFKSAIHRKRFLETMQNIRKVYQGKLDVEYASAVYILTADMEIWRKAERYVSSEGIEIAEMLQEQDFSSSYRVLVKLAGNLFNGDQKPTPLDLLDLDTDNYYVALTALTLRRFQFRYDAL